MASAVTGHGVQTTRWGLCCQTPERRERAPGVVARTLDQLVRESLVIPLAMIVRREFVEGPTKMPFAERSDAIQTLLRDGAHEPLRLRVAVRRTWWCPGHTNAHRLEQPLDRTTPLRIAIADQRSAGAKESSNVSPRSLHTGTKVDSAVDSTLYCWPSRMLVSRKTAVGIDMGAESFTTLNRFENHTGSSTRSG